MHRLEDLEAFVAILDEGSFTAAARALRRSLQSVSRSLATLEESIGVELVRRTTRRSHPTEAGRRFYSRIRPALLEISDAGMEASNQRAEPVGLLRISAPVLFAPVHVVPALAEFLERYPKIEVELSLSDRFLDLVENGIDLAVRIGDLPDSELKARRLGALRRVVYGSPMYLAKHGRPSHPSELADHQCLVRRLDVTSEAWPFQIDGESHTIRVSGRLRTDSTAATYSAAALGLGLGFTPLWQVRDLVERGELEIVLAEYETQKVPIHAVTPAAKIPLPAARLFAEHLARRLSPTNLEGHR
ncbi:Transcriptional regulator [Bosea sp. 62]|nr:Transcriptional regulator [Bosea sp. 46]CAD5265289.1 Transcriptional regulator [Bosea sp. 21B]CAD5275060.1 Transcriptional regulator [Bosea sp. 7B]VVT59194.1 DNA-binding transcriptional regulator, LysR family [Bosea sp. EC-HK365B]VXB73142.1 Transcriptional regulator [Bosea sp. 29B]VXC12540.1 Transcriptional regulator [Bosea sp. 125]VXC29067.1 Transcriptional regulator [Bosea sp. 62]VXC74756.1 Transcriptional regulator [Bosea sp. 127]